jgi:hypothetical protein
MNGADAAKVASGNQSARRSGNRSAGGMGTVAPRRPQDRKVSGYNPPAGNGRTKIV